MRLSVPLAAALGLIVTMATPALALTSHTSTFQAGSAIDIDGGRRFDLVGPPQCNDGVDNDQDVDIDTADDECDAGGGNPASADDNECQDGFQAESAAPTLTFDDDGAGNLTNLAITLPPADVCTSTIIGQLCFRVAITVDTSAASGDVTPVVANTSGEITASNLDFIVAVGACSHHPAPGFNGTNCRVTFPDVGFDTQHASPRGAAFDGVQYTEGGGQGQTTLATRIGSGPSFASGSCGSFFGTDYASELNTNLGLPGNVDVILPQVVVPDLSSV